MKDVKGLNKRRHRQCKRELLIDKLPTLKPQNLKPKRKTVASWGQWIHAVCHLLCIGLTSATSKEAFWQQNHMQQCLRWKNTLQERNGHVKAKMTCSYCVQSADIQAQVYWKDEPFKSRRGIGMGTQPETTEIKKKKKIKRSYLNFTPG